MTKIFSSRSTFLRLEWCDQFHFSTISKDRGCIECTSTSSQGDGSEYNHQQCWSSQWITLGKHLLVRLGDRLSLSSQGDGKWFYSFEDSTSSIDQPWQTSRSVSLLAATFVESFVSARSPSSDNESDGIPQKSSRSKSRQQPISTTFEICSFLSLSLSICFRKKILPNPSSLIAENTHPFVVDVRPSRERESSGDLQEAYRSTLRDLDFERDRRWRAEQEIKHLNDRLEDFQRSQPTTTNGNILQELNDKHQQRLDEEKSKFQDLAKIVDDYKVNRERQRRPRRSFFSRLETSSKYRRSIVIVQESSGNQSSIDSNVRKYSQ